MVVDAEQNVSLSVAWRVLVACLIGALAVSLTACGSTKVYEARKTIVYQGEMYNVTDTKKFTAVVQGQLPSGQAVDLAQAERKQVERLVDENGPIPVRLFFTLDDVELLYREVQVARWNDLRGVRDKFDRAAKEIAELMRKENASQINLD